MSAFSNQPLELELACSLLFKKHKDQWTLKALAKLHEMSPKNGLALRRMLEIQLGMKNPAAAHESLKKIQALDEKEALQHITHLVIQLNSEKQGLQLAELFETSEHADELLFHSQALRLLSGDKKKLRNLPVEMQNMVLELADAIASKSKQTP